MTFPIFGSEYAPCILDARPPSSRTPVQDNAVAIDLVRLFGLNRPPSGKRLVCRWHREVDGRLACHWERDIVPMPQR
jgi:hypothetical protein